MVRQPSTRQFSLTRTHKLLVVDAGCRAHRNTWAYPHPEASP